MGIFSLIWNWFVLVLIVAAAVFFAAGLWKLRRQPADDAGGKKHRRGVQRRIAVSEGTQVIRCVRRQHMRRRGKKHQQQRQLKGDAERRMGKRMHPPVAVPDFM